VTINLDNAVVYDLETFPNCFTMNVSGLYSDLDMTFEISKPIDGQGRDHREQLLQWFYYWEAMNTPMIGFNSVAFDYSVLHFIYDNPYASVEDIYDHAMSLINASFGGNRFASQIFPSDRFAPQIDLFKLHHFDNPAKRTSLKALEVNMRSETVSETSVPFGTMVTRDQIDRCVVPYNKDDTRETKKFALYSMDAIKFRVGLSDTIKGDVLNFPDTKIGAKILEQRLGDDLCYSREFGARQPRQSIRDRIRLADIIFPYVQFRNAEFNRILDWMRGQVLSADELTESTIVTKGVFKGVSAHVGGIDFVFGTGGIHGSVESQRFQADAEWGIFDIDVASLYPNIAIVNRLYPEHLGERFVEEYAKLPLERKEWQEKKGKKCAEANSMKLASNGTYGNSNNKYSVFYDPRFTMAITINGQLLLCMLAEWLLTVPSLSLVQINTDGITYRCRRDQVEKARVLQAAWERYTCLALEEAQYGRMWIRDVNSYVAEGLDGALKQKGAYWFPRKFPDDISNAQPPAWHKDFSNCVSTMAAVEHMVTGVSVEEFIYGYGNPFDFMCRAKVDRSSSLKIGDKEVQRITRYYVANDGGAMKKISPPVKGAQVGEFKRKSGIGDFEWSHAVPGVWDERYHTKNKSRYEIREMGIESGFLVAECNRAADFDFQNVNYEWYIDRAKKLVIT
jgi:hypothetical protein